MACTIDHLRVDHRVTVLRDFTDLAGITIRAGETGVLRGLGLDYPQMEIWLELERGGAPQKLRFALRASDGPRNGRMKDYFEMGDPIETPSAPAKPTEPPPPEEPKRPQFQPCASRQAPNDTSLGELRVACNCDTAFHREVLPARGELSLWACLHCGTVTCSRSLGDDGRFTGNAWQENRTVALSDAVHGWVSNWPRVKMDYTAHSRWPMSSDFVRYPTLYYPADARCADLAQLDKLESRLVREQAGQSSAQRLRATHRVKSAPSGGVPDQLRGYVMLWEALQLRSSSDLSDLLHLAQPRSLGCEVAAEVLRQRPDAFELIVNSLRSGDAMRRGVGFMIARDLRPADPRLAGVLIEMLGNLSCEPLPDVPNAIASRGQCEMLLLLIAELKQATPEMLSTLRALMRKLARHDAFLVDCIRIVLHELDPANHAAPSSASNRMFLAP
jgi:hypothetical protein